MKSGLALASKGFKMTSEGKTPIDFKDPVSLSSKIASLFVRRDLLIDKVLVRKSKDARARVEWLFTYDHQIRKIRIKKQEIYLQDNR